MAFRDTKDCSIVFGVKVPAGVVEEAVEWVDAKKKGTTFRARELREQLVGQVRVLRGAKSKAKAKKVSGALASRVLRRLKSSGKVTAFGYKKQSYTVN